MEKVALSDRVLAANYIFEGKVISKQSFWNTDNNLIFTANIIEIYKVFKGNINVSQVEIVTEGGMVGLEMHLVNPSLGLSIGQIGIFLAEPATELNSTSNIPVAYKFQPYASAQGFIEYDLIDRIGIDPFYTYNDIKQDIYKTITNLTGVNIKVVSPFDISKKGKSNAGSRATPVITSLSPDSTYAGTFDTLTINGSNFGASYTGSANVEFRNADNGGSGYMSVPAVNIVSWAAGQIKVIVPGGAGTGTVRVTNSTAETGTSAASVTIIYNQTNTLYSGAYYPIDLIDSNGVGGYTYKYNTQFNDSSEAAASFERAMMTWRYCGTGFNIDKSGTTSINCDVKDSVNVVLWDDPCTLSASTLGRSRSYYVACWTGSWQWSLRENDVKFNITKIWNFGPGEASPGENDFESVALHELGHTHQLGHIIASGFVMHYAITVGTEKRVLDPLFDIAGGNDIMSRSIILNGCGPTQHIPLGDTATWTGTTDTVWAKATNWDIGFVPDSCNVIYIPGTYAAPTQPSISTIPVKIKGIIIESDSSAIIRIGSGGLIIKEE